MQKFSTLNTTSKSLNESIEIDSLDGFVSFGKKILYNILSVLYKEEEVTNYLTNLYNSSQNTETLLEKLNEFTMDKEERNREANRKFNSLISEMLENPSDNLITTKIVKLTKKYPLYLNETLLSNADYLVNSWNIDSEKNTKLPESVLNNNNIKTSPLKSYSPKDISEVTKILNAFKTAIHEAIVESEPKLIDATPILPQGFGGLGIDFAELLDNQKKRASDLETDIKQLVNNINVISEEEKSERNIALQYLKSILNDELDQYYFTPEFLQSNIKDIDFFIMICLYTISDPIQKNIEYLQRMAVNIKISQINNLYNEYLSRTGLENATWNFIPQEPGLLILGEPSYAKLYELCDIVLGLSKYQRIDIRKITLKIVTSIKPLIDLIEFDKQIFNAKSQSQY